uniref:Imaginal disc growth factor n=1 Tax=Rhyacophila obliterata TaxID=460686 RepID=A0A5Q0MUU0_9NEOP|nr:imaginal disc growth factor [Rhyacophila obliterata]
MANFLAFWLALSSAAFITGSLADNMMPPKVVCYYDSRSYIRETQAKMLPSDLDPALPYCTHLIYGYAGIDAATHKMVSLNTGLDLDQGHANYRVITQLKRKFPALKILLSVGGDADTEGTEKYLTLLETPEARVAFINSAVVILKNYGFDGIDLAWEFPKVKPKKIRGSLGSFWHGFKKVFTGDSILDEKAEEHKLGFTKLVQELKNAIRPDNFLMTASVLPSVNSTHYFDTHSIMNYLDFIILDAYDYYTPERNPKQADYPAPLYELHERNPELNVDSIVTWWVRNAVPSYKLVLGIPTYARTWKMTSDSEGAGVPPITVDGPAPEGPYTKQAGLLSFPEVCSKLTNPNNQKGLHTHLRKVTDPSKRFGTYAFRVADDNDEGGIWVGYEDADTTGNKAAYVKAKGLGGIAINDLSLDDFRGLCSGDKFPLLRAAKYRL